ncbi:N-acetyl-ornithine/N-acetyl-lysine deacetylase [Nitrosopumilaceae archaeon]|nr:M20/M25/M40 family metallo-hydrolase [Nitrosopumilus sp.]CAI9830893.1 N-acetyl-ornithine/N-acetyl-lysine deacetylase [Nitrosopumilaceae archaeon]MDA7945299.1 M20/M25/M40 family metallo-hydrolase [Nitrosopumilus sp.]MDA7955275.1 M20/M25/M40 family metallo-hydrolase [Nitrosopumilus sp.]MDA7974247.1 M20/M25/M40 family metallo-hydrolase [Nitrosopumilus sp.]
MTRDVTPGFATDALERALGIYTPSLSEAPLAEYLGSLCRDIGFSNVRTDGVGNLIAEKGSGSPRILLCGHMDVVPGKVRVRREGDMLYGRGASDAKAPLLAMLFAAATAEEGGGSVVFVGAVDEEGSATGVKNLVKGEKTDYAVFGEPSGTGRVTIAYKGRLAINLRVRTGGGAHASAPWLSGNAIEESVAIAAAIKGRLEAGQESRSKGMMRTATMTGVRGGTSHNVIPGECETTFDIRIPVGGSCKETEQEVSEIVGSMSSGEGIEAFYSILDETEPFEAPHDSALVRAFTLAVMGATGSRPALVRKTGTGDMNVLGNRWGIPVVTYGPGDPHEAHTADEKVSIREYLLGIEVLKGAIRHIVRLHRR